MNIATTNNYQELLDKEWLVTNGLGGYASGTLCGANSRRYHGVLVAAMNPPVDRLVLVNKVEAAIKKDGEWIALSANQYPDGVVHPRGFYFLKSWQQELVPVFDFQVGDYHLRCQILMVHGSNTTILAYQNLGKEDFLLQLTPFFTYRNYHSLLWESSEYNFYHDSPNKDTLRIFAKYGATPVFVKSEDFEFKEQHFWVKNLEYEMEKYRGLDYQEDAAVIGHWQSVLKKGQTAYLMISTDKPILLKKVPALWQKECQRLQNIQKIPKISSSDDFITALYRAADQFLVKRNTTDAYSLLAGYHWFTDWGRDAMIAMRGLTIATGNQDASRSILATFLYHIDKGMIPNRFPDHSSDAIAYNTVDATLWLFIVLYEYFQKFGDGAFIEQHFEQLSQVIYHHFEGTRYQIQARESGFLYAGTPDVQLTWMDAKVGDFVVTPRTGFAVEIQALWYNALRIWKFFADELSLKPPKELYRSVTHCLQQLESNFSNYFLNQQGYLNDVVQPDRTADDAFRPNQIFVLSLPFQLLSPKVESGIFTQIKEQLFTPYGLRSLSANHPDYQGTYGGDQWQRDTSYHQGTVWSWLAGDYWLAYLRLNNYSQDAKHQVVKEMEALKNHFYNQNCLHGISEIFDGDAPHTARGTIQQAWSIGALLMVLEKIQQASSQ